MNQNTLDITLFDREYQVACSPEERESLLKAAAYVNEQAHTFTEKTQASRERLAMMVALNIAHELLTVKAPMGSATDIQSACPQKVTAMQAKLDAVLRATSTSTPTSTPSEAHV